MGLRSSNTASLVPRPSQKAVPRILVNMFITCILKLRCELYAIGKGGGGGGGGSVDTVTVTSVVLGAGKGSLARDAHSSDGTDGPQ